MPVEVIMPMLGMAQETGKVVRWLKAEGEAVVKAEPLMEVETDKVTVEIFPGTTPWPSRSAVEVSSAWQTMARRMSETWQQVPHFYLSREVEATRLNGWRAAVRRRPGYERVTHTDLLVKIVAAALAEHPRVNGSAEVNVGIAVATDDVLVVPVIHGADRLELRAVAERRIDVVARAREGKLRLEDGSLRVVSNARTAPAIAASICC